jgi:hypothetical protein
MLNNLNKNQTLNNNISNHVVYNEMLNTNNNLGNIISNYFNKYKINQNEKNQLYDALQQLDNGSIEKIMLIFEKKGFECKIINKNTQYTDIKMTEFNKWFSIICVVVLVSLIMLLLYSKWKDSDELIWYDT